jgi:hypothetical protein
MRSEKRSKLKNMYSAFEKSLLFHMLRRETMLDFAAQLFEPSNKSTITAKLSNNMVPHPRIACTQRKYKTNNNCIFNLFLLTKKPR